MTGKNNQPDWSREEYHRFQWKPSIRLINSIRSYQRCRDAAGPIARLACKWHVLSHRFWSMVTGADIPLNSNLGGGLLLPHPNGVVIHPRAVIGSNCTIFQQVTIGTSNGPEPPHIGENVDIGPGAKVLGNIRVGSHSLIGANAVVLKDVPDHHKALGIPAVNYPRETT